MRWSVALALGRVSNLPTVWTNALAGVVLAGGAAGDARLPWIVLAVSLCYVAGMYLNDAFDRDFDARHRPERVERRGQRPHPLEGEPAPRRLEPDRAACRRRDWW